jgi:hypothetical protein
LSMIVVFPAALGPSTTTIMLNSLSRESPAVPQRRVGNILEDAADSGCIQRATGRAEP